MPGTRVSAKPLLSHHAAVKTPFTHGVGGPSVEVVLHGTEPKEIRDETSVRIASGLHSGLGFEPVDELGEWRSVDARDDLEHATLVFLPVLEPDLIAGHPLIVPVRLSSLRRAW